MIKRMITLVFIELYVVAFSALVFVLVKLRKARRTFLFTRPPRITSSDQLPSVSVCIPARNETHAMSECLESVLASDYPKLEAIVLDDTRVITRRISFVRSHTRECGLSRATSCRMTGLEKTFRSRRWQMKQAVK